ncbi:sugar phosphate isomerase/epimerase family protein [Nocardia carnea]|uniref:sugar phosphate isomerase/epimerase family protein n=1 Tax=Nocardia carnea TaxID=37328 RepID=UPI002456274C|nr:sugar phosphate isomerase/epimerase family protein [Nocardia carnea]
MTWTMRYTTHLGYRPPDFRPQFLDTVGTAEPAAHVRYAAELGMAGILYPWALSRPADEVRAVSRALDEVGLAGSCVVCVPTTELTTGIWTDRGAAARSRLEAYVRQSAEIAVSLRSGILAALISTDPERTDHERQRGDAAANLADMARIAADHGVVLAVEPMVQLPGMMLRTTQEAVSFVAAADQANLGIIYDTAHVAMMDGDLMAALRAAWEHIVLLQVADLPGRVEAGAGELAIAEVLAEAVRSGYTGLVDLEHDWIQPTAEGERFGLERVRRLDASVRRSVRPHLAGLAGEGGVDQ